jgi:uncharacterized membrane protein
MQCAHGLDHLYLLELPNFYLAAFMTVQSKGQTPLRLKKWSKHSTRQQSKFRTIASLFSMVVAVSNFKEGNVNILFFFGLFLLLAGGCIKSNLS